MAQSSYPKSGPSRSDTGGRAGMAKPKSRKAPVSIDTAKKGKRYHFTTKRAAHDKFQRQKAKGAFK